MHVVRPLEAIGPAVAALARDGDLVVTLGRRVDRHGRRRDSGVARRDGAGGEARRERGTIRRRGHPAGADRRFRRARLGPAVRRRRDRLARLSTRPASSPWSLGLAGVFWFAGRLVLESPRFRVDRVVVRGNDRLSSGEVAALVDGLQGQRSWRLDLEAWRRRLRESAWMRGRGAAPHRARNDRDRDHRARAARRRPRSATALFLLDARGVVIDDFGPQYADLDLPVIDGLGAAPTAASAAAEPTPGRWSPDGCWRRCRRGAICSARVSQIDVSEAHDAVVLLDGDPARLHLGEDAFVERLQSYLELAPTLRARVSEIDYVDLRFDGRVFVRPAAGSGHVARRREGPGPE